MVSVDPSVAGVHPIQIVQTTIAWMDKVVVGAADSVNHKMF